MTVQTETALSPPYRALRTLLKPFKPLLVKPGKPQPAGSPRIANAPKRKLGCRVVEHHEDGVWTYELVPPSSSSASSPSSPTADAAAEATADAADARPRRRRHIYYFSGGAFQSLPTAAHWTQLATLARTLAPHGYAAAHMVSYPLAPHTPAAESLPMLRAWLRGVLERAAARDELAVLAGDSSGGNVALSLTFWWVQQLQLQEQEQKAQAEADAAEAEADAAEAETETAEQQQQQQQGISKSALSDTLVISPATDMQNDNPAMTATARHDPLLSPTYTGDVAAQWTRGMPRTDPAVSPVLHSARQFAALRACGVRVHGVVGTFDVLAPDALRFKDRCEEVGVEGDWLVWEGQMHCFPLVSSYGIREGKEAVDWMCKLLAKQAAEHR